MRPTAYSLTNDGDNHNQQTTFCTMRKVFTEITVTVSRQPWSRENKRHIKAALAIFLKELTPQDAKYFMEASHLKVRGEFATQIENPNWPICAVDAKLRSGYGASYHDISILAVKLGNLLCAPVTFDYNGSPITVMPKEQPDKVITDLSLASVGAGHLKKAGKEIVAAAVNLLPGRPYRALSDGAKWTAKKALRFARVIGL